MLRALDLYCRITDRFPSWSCCRGVLRVLAKLRFPSWSCGGVIGVLDLRYKVEISETCAAKMRFQAGVPHAQNFYYKLAGWTSTGVLRGLGVCASKLRFLSWSCGSGLRILDLHYSELELWKRASRTKPQSRLIFQPQVDARIMVVLLCGFWQGCQKGVQMYPAMPQPPQPRQCLAVGVRFGASKMRF